MKIDSLLQLLNIHAVYNSAGIGGPSERPYFDGIRAAAELLGQDNGLELKYNKASNKYYFEKAK